MGGLANAKQGVSGGDKNRVQNFFSIKKVEKAELHQNYSLLVSLPT